MFSITQKINGQMIILPEGLDNYLFIIRGAGNHA